MVKAGESLWLLAKRNGVSIDQLQSANGLTSTTIKPGQKLQIPSKSEQKVSAKTRAAALPKQKSGRRASSEALVEAKTSAAKPVEAKPSPVKPAVTSLSPVSAKAREEAEALYASATTPPLSTLEEIAPSWVLRRPGASTQGEKSNAERGGVYPCVAPDPGFGVYSKWVQVAPMAHVLAPTTISIAKHGSFDVLFHFHGREPIRKEWVRSMERGVLVAIDVGIDSGAYATAFQDPRTFGQVLRAVEAEITKRNGDVEARVGKVALSSWSAGFGALEQILSQPRGQQVVDAVVLLDGLHSGYDGDSLDAAKMAPFVRFARAAAAGTKLLFVSHSSILTTGYASTTETAQYLTWKVGGRPETVEPLDVDPMGLERMLAYSSGGFHVRGFRGSGAADHCAHLGLMRDVLRVHLGPRWLPNLAPKAAPKTAPDADQPMRMSPGAVALRDHSDDN